MKKNYQLLKLCFTLTIVILLAAQGTYSQKVTFSDNWNKAGFNLKAQARSGVSIGYSVSEFTFTTADINGRSMTNIELPGFWLPNDEGAPNLPGGGRYIAIPQGCKPVLNITSVRRETYKNIDIAPAPRIPLDTDRGPLQFSENPDIYASNAFYPASPVQISQPTDIRGVDVVMLGITPFQYNPVTKELVVYRDIEIEIQFTGGNGHFGEDRLRSRFWDPILSDDLLNYASLPKIDYAKRAISQRSDNGCEYLIIVPDAPEFSQWAEQIREFRIHQGITTEIVTLGEIGGNNTTLIENYINNAYSTWDPAPAACLLMADYGTSQTNSIISPIWNSYCVSDNIYADVDNDMMPEVVMARMTANNAAELEVYVSKFLNYETNPPTSAGFYDHPITALGWQTVRWFQLCSEVVGGYLKNVKGKNPVRVNAVYEGNPSSDPWSTAQNTSTILSVFGPSGLGYIPATPQELGGFSGGNASMINDAINNGSFMLQHRDHGMETGWGEPSYTNSNIDGLTNTDLTFVFSVNCLTGKYNWTSECFAEKFHRYTHNGLNSGALGLIAASEVSYSFVNDTYVWGLYDNLWPDFMPQYESTPEPRGELPAFGNAAGKYFLQQSGWPYNSGDKEVTYNLFHHHGDAFLCLYSEVPQDLTIIHSGVILAGYNQFTITADEGSTICLTVGNEIIGLAQGTGAPLVMTILPQPVGTVVHLTATKQNYYRHEENLMVIPSEGPYCIYDSHIVHDSLGNGNGLIDYNETISLDLTMRNVGATDGSNVTVKISTTDPYVSLIDSTENYGNILAGETVTIPDGFTFAVGQNIPDQHKVFFDVTAISSDITWSSSFVIKANAPLLNINSLTINDQANGNGNGKLDPGEQVTMTINYNNTGHATAYNVDVYLEGQSGFVQIPNPNANFPFIGFFGAFNKTFDVTVDADAPEGIIVNFVNELTMGNFFKDKIFPEKISAKMEDFETGDFSKFPWQFTGNQPWQIISDYPYEGFHSAKSGVITHGQSSEIKLTYNVMTADSITFIRKVSSEPNDKLQFFIGNEKMGEWFGTTSSWSRESFPVNPGSKTFRWVYKKDGSNTGGADCAWLDMIVFPPPVTLTIWAGPDSKVCPGESFAITESQGTDFVTAAWITSGTGTFDDATILQPVYTPSIEDIAAGQVSLTLTLTDGGGANVTDDMILAIKAAPVAPGMPQGPAYVDLYVTQTSEYSTDGVSGVSQYHWYLDPPEAGVIDGNTDVATVTWNPAYLGPAMISVAGINECGEGIKSESFLVTVDNTVGITNPSDLSLDLSVNPNPGTGLFTVTLKSRNPAEVQFRVMNILGEMIYHDSFRLNGSARIQVDLRNVPDGIYFLVAGDPGNSVSKKIIKR